MRKVLTYLVLLFLVFLYTISLHYKVLNKVTDYSFFNHFSFLQSDMNRYGGLYGISFLKQFKQPFPKRQLNEFSNDTDSGALYVIGDSYMKMLRLNSRLFKSVDTLYYADWRESSVPLSIDSKKLNVLIIESTERYFVGRFADSASLYYPFDEYSEGVKMNRQKTVGDRVNELLASRVVNDNLEYLFFDYHFLTPLKELRAEVNYRCFNRLPSNIYLSDDGKMLLYGETIDTTMQTSSFKPVDDLLLDRMVQNCNRFAAYYRSKGLKKIYFSIIPNPVSIIGYRNYQYNQLISRIQHHPNRHFEMIDVYEPFKASNKQLFIPSDTHWNYEAAQMWIDQVNLELVNN